MSVFSQHQNSNKVQPSKTSKSAQHQVPEIVLPEVQLFKKLRFRKPLERSFYLWYQKKTLKAYPFAVIAAKELSVVEEKLDSLKSRRARRRHTRKVHEQMESKFENQLKQLTRTEGKILIKLIHRFTGETTFELVKKYRSRWKAYLYQRVAKMHKISLKDTYNPEESLKDYIIEDILQRAFLNEIIEEYPSKLNFNYFELSRKYAHRLH